MAVVCGGVGEERRDSPGHLRTGINTRGGVCESAYAGAGVSVGREGCQESCELFLARRPRLPVIHDDTRKLEHCCHISPLTWPCLSSSLSPTLLRPQPGHLSIAGDAGQPVLPLLFTQPSGHGPVIASTFAYVCIIKATVSSASMVEPLPSHSILYRTNLATGLLGTHPRHGITQGGVVDFLQLYPRPVTPSNTPSASLPGSAVAVV